MYKSFRISSPASATLTIAVLYVHIHGLYVQAVLKEVGNLFAMYFAGGNLQTFSAHMLYSRCSYSTYSTFSIIFYIDLRINAGLTKEALKREIKNAFRYQRLFLYVPFTYALIHYFINAYYSFSQHPSL